MNARLLLRRITSRSPRFSIGAILMLSLGAASPPGDAQLQKSLASTISFVQNEYRRIPSTTVIKAMDKRLLIQLYKATPQTMVQPSLSAAGVQHTKIDTLIVFWICATPAGEGVEIKNKTTNESFTLPVSEAWAKVNIEQSQGGSLRMNMIVTSDDAPQWLLDVLRHPSNYTLALRSGGKTIQNWVPILENTTPSATQPAQEPQGSGN